MMVPARPATSVLHQDHLSKSTFTTGALLVLVGELRQFRGLPFQPMSPRKVSVQEFFTICAADAETRASDSASLRRSRPGRRFCACLLGHSGGLCRRGPPASTAMTFSSRMVICLPCDGYILIVPTFIIFLQLWKKARSPPVFSLALV